MSFQSPYHDEYFDPNTGTVVGVIYRENTDGTMGHTKHDISPWKVQNREPAPTGHYASGNYEDLFPVPTRFPGIFSPELYDLSSTGYGGSPGQELDPELRRRMLQTGDKPTDRNREMIKDILRQLSTRKAQLAPQHMDNALQDWPHGDPAFKGIQLLRDPSHDLKQMEAIMKSPPGFPESLVPRV